MSQFFHSNPAARPPSGPKDGPWRRGLPRTWQAAFDLSDAPHDLPTEAGTYRLGPDDGTLSLRTGRTGAAAKAGHDLLIHVTVWEGTLMAGDDPADASIELNADGRSLRVREGTGGMKSLTDDDRAEIAQAIDDEILKGHAITFRSTQVRPADGGGLSVQGDLTLVGETRPIAFDLAASDDGAHRATVLVKQTDWGIKPYSILFGALKVADEVEVGIEVRLPAELIPAWGPRTAQSL